MRIMLDTNVLVSALLFPGQKMNTLMEKVTTGHQLVLSSYIVNELFDVAQRLADDGLSYTEKEYDYAVTKKIPVLAFLHEHPGQIPADFTDPENAIKLAEFRKKVSTKRLIKYWTTADNLSVQVQAALLNAFEVNPKTGWVRADSVIATAQLEAQLSHALKINDENQHTIDALRGECSGLNVKLDESLKQGSVYKSQLDESKKQSSIYKSQLDEALEQGSILQSQLDESLSQVKQLSQQLAILPKSQLQTKDMETLFIGDWKGKPLEWLILKKQPGKVLLIAKDCLLKAPYNEEQQDVTWADCSLRNKVLSDFMEQIFDDKERSKVLLRHNRNNDNAVYNTPGGIDTDDFLFLLSIDEVTQYFPDTKTRIAYLNGETVWWWLRSPGYRSGSAANVYADGYVRDYGIDVWWSGAVRPAFWLNLES